MLEDFFQFGPIPTYQMLGSYDLRLVLLSYLVATFASYIALDITGRVRDVGNTALTMTIWIFGGAFAMGAGIWSMHFIGMLAFSMPAMPSSYDPFWTGLSMVVAIIASSITFIILKNETIDWRRIALGGIILGFAIASMHYVGMEAMKIIADIHYLPSYFLLSIIIAIIASEAALWLALKSSQVIAKIRFRLKIVSAFIMGAAICGMHYTGMAAAIFTPKAYCNPNVASLDPQILAISIAGVTFIILGIAVIVSTYKEAQNQLLLSKARQAGMAEVAASVLHNVGNVLNSLNTSASTINEKIIYSKLTNLNDLNMLITQHKHDLNHFLTEDPTGKQIPDYINKITEYWNKEKKVLSNELDLLIKNIEHIKSIIAMQQNLSRVTTLEQVVEVNDVLEEALYITGIETNHPEITIEKNYYHLQPIVIDKIKLLQIVVNLLRNAKDALAEVNQKDKKIIIKTNLSAVNKIIIEVTDNGCGILHTNLVKIFSYGFTTKKEGHGFGLHSSAIAAKEMGGTLSVYSDGLNKGATFIVEVPNQKPL